MNRRRFLTYALACISALVQRNSWAKRADFAPGQFNDLLAQLLPPATRLQETEQLQISAPEIAENGAVVPITISTSLPGIEQIMVLVEKNPTPLAARFAWSGPALPYVETRIKMAESCPIVVLAKRGNDWLVAKRWVTVIMGGCGTG